MYLGCNLMITSKVNSLEEINSTIWLKWDRWWSKWDKRIPPKWKWNGTYYDFTASIICFSLDSQEVEEHIEYLLDKVLPFKKWLLSFLSLSESNYATIKIFLSEIKHTWISLNKEILKKLGILWLEIDIDIYK